MALSQEMFSENFKTPGIISALKENAMTTANFSSNETGFRDYYNGSHLDGNVSNTRNMSLNRSEYHFNYYGYDEYYVPTPDVTAIVLVIFGFILLVGIVGNILVIIIIAAVKSMHTTVNKCLFSLALADLVILTVLPISPIIGDFTESTFPLGRELCYVISYYDRGAVICSVLTFFYVSIDRYFALCYPLKSRALWTGKKTYIILVAIWIVSLALSYPFLHNMRYEEVYYDNTNHYFCYFDTVENNWMKWYDTFFRVSTVSVPIPVLLVLYGRMIYRIRGSVSKSNSGNTGDEVAGRRGRGQVVVLLLVVVVIYIVSQLPAALLRMFSYHFQTVFSTWPYDKNVFTIVWITRILIYVNSAANPVIYFSLSTNFRQGFQQVFFCNGGKKSQINSRETQKPTL